MIELTENQLFDYIKCPLRYDAQYNVGMAVANHPSMNELLGRVTRAFMVNLMNGKVIPTSQIKRKWDKICEDNHIVPQKCLEGMGLLLKMYQWAESEQLTVLDINAPFQYSILNISPQISIRGEVHEYIVPKDNNRFELLEIDFGNRYPDQAILDMKLRYTIDWNVCRNRIKDAELAGIHIHHVKSNKDWFTFRGPDDFVRLDESIKAIASCIDKKIFYPRENVLCSSCDMKMYCRAWRGTV